MILDGRLLVIKKVAKKLLKLVCAGVFRRRVVGDN